MYWKNYSIIDIIDCGRHKLSFFQSAHCLPISSTLPRFTFILKNCSIRTSTAFLSYFLQICQLAQLWNCVLQTMIHHHFGLIYRQLSGARQRHLYTHIAGNILQSFILLLSNFALLLLLSIFPWFFWLALRIRFAATCSVRFFLINTEIM